METILVALTDDLQDHLNQGGSTLLILLDLLAEFDTVDHMLLAHHLANLGDTGIWLSMPMLLFQGCGKRVTLGGWMSP